MNGSSPAPTGHAPCAVVLRFRPEVAGQVQALPWHPSQKTTPAPDGGLFVQFGITDLRALLRWVLWWGADCEVIQPEGFRKMIREELEWMVEKY